MQRLIFGYAPANLVPAALSICGIVLFTRMLSAPAFGAYNLAFSVVMVAQSVLFFAPTLAITRFYAAAQPPNGSVASFLKTIYLLTIAIGGVAVIGAVAAAILLKDIGTLDVAGTTAMILPLLLLRAMIATNQTVNRAAGHMHRFNAIECLHAAIGLAAGVAFVTLGDRSGGAVMAGLLVGATICAALDIRKLGCLRAAVPVDRRAFAEIVRFSWPLVLSFLLASCLQYADRFIVGHYAGIAELGIYVVAFSLVDRPISLICLSITAGTFQMAVDTYVRDGAEAGRLQAGRNGAVLLGLALPACIGLMLTSQSIAAVVVGPAFRDGVGMLIPIMAVTALLRGVGAHYVDHAFHLANRSFRLFAVYAPSAVGNILLSLLLVPRYGMIAAAYGALACQAVAIVAGWLIARRVLPLWLPAGQMLRMAACLALMTAALVAIPLPVGWIGLVGGAAIGLAVYLAGAVAFDLGDLRRTARRAILALTRSRQWKAG